MAENDKSLIFPVGFEMDDAIQTAMDKFEKEKSKLEKIFNVTLKFKADMKSLDNLDDVQKRLKELKLEPVTPETRAAITELVKELKTLESILLQVDKINREMTKSSKELSNVSLQSARIDVQKTKVDTEVLSQIIKEQEAIERSERLKAESQARIDAMKKKTSDDSVRRSRETSAKIEAIEKTSESKSIANAQIASARKDEIERRSADNSIANKRKTDAQVASIEQTTINRSLVGAEQVRAAKARAEAAEERLSQAKQRGLAATERQNKAYVTQSGLLNGLKQSMNAYISIMGMTRLARNIREVTAEFELQKVALTAILQDKAEADKLFDQTVALAVKSPFQIKEMVGFNKQLAAYRIGTDELFDTTRRLADVSAGLGVEMSRLILAYGQVSAASILRGQEVRQFTEAGIPLIQLLADKFTELNGVATTTGDVFQLISERAVPFEMVKEIFQDMTNEGGIFYDMQRKQADTLHGVYSNLRDAWDVAFNEMGQRNMWILKGIGEAMTNLAGGFKTLDDVLTPVIISWGIYKLAMMAVIKKKAELSMETTLLIALEAKQHKIFPARIAAMMKESHVMKLQAIQTRLLITAKGRLAQANGFLSKSFHRLTVAMLSNPWIALAAAIAGVIVAIIRYTNHGNEAARMNKKIAESTNELKSSSDASIASFDYLMNRLKNAKHGTREYADIINELNRRYGDFLPQQLKVSQSYDEVANSVRGVTEAIKEKARAESLSAAQSTIESKFKSELEKNKERGVKLLTSLHAYDLAGNIRNLVSESQASDIWRGVVSTIDKNPEKYKSAEAIAELTQDAINEAFKGKGLNMPVDKAFELNKYTINRFNKTVNSMAETVVEFGDKLDEARNSVNAAYGAEIPKTYLDIVKDINDEFEKLKVDNKNIMPDLEYKEEIHQANMRRIKQLIAVYNEAGQASMVRRMEQELKEAESISKGWFNIATSIATEAGLGTLAPTEDDKIFAFISNAKKEYKELQEQLKLINSGLNLDDQGKELSYVTRNMSVLEAQAKALNFSLTELSERDINKAANERVKAVEDEIKLLTEAYERYKKLTADMSRGEAVKEIEKVYTAVPAGGFAFDEDDFIAKYESLIDKLRKVGADASKLQKVNLDLFDYKIDPIQKKAQDDLKKMGDDIARQQKANKFFEKLIGAGTGVELATAMTINFYGFDPNDIRDKMIQQLQDAMGGIELDLTPQGGIDFDKVLKNIDNLPNISENAKKRLKELTESIRENDAEAIESLYSNLSKYSEYEQRRIKILEDASERRRIIQQQGLGGEAQVVSDKKQAQDMAALEFDMFKDSSLYTTMFENLDKVSTSALNAIMLKLKAFKDANKENLDPTQIRELTKSFEDVEKKMVERNPFKAISDSLAGIKQVSKDAEQANKDVANSIALLTIEEENLRQAMIVRQQLIDSGKSTEQIDKEIESISKEIRLREEQLGVEVKISNELKRRLEVIGASLIKIGQEVGGFADGFGAVRDVMKDWGADEETSETMATLGDIQNAVSGVGTAASGVGKIMAGDFSGIADVVKGASQAVKGFVGIFTGANRKIARANKEIKKQAEIIADLGRKYEQLRRDMDDALGSDFAKKSIESTALLEAQVIATQKQIQAEKSKGKKTDKDKIRELEKQQDELNQKIKEQNKELSETILGTDVGGTARDFARAWLDAYLSFDNTTDAIEEKFKSMLQNMIVESILAKAIEQRIETLFKDAGAIWDEKGSLNMGNLNKIIGQIDTLPEEISQILDAVTKGLNMEALKAKQEGSLTGLSKAVGSMSEETALVLAAAANSGLYYNVAQYNELVLIRDILLRWETSRGSTISGTSTDGGINNLIAVQNLALIELQLANVSLTDIAESNREIQDLIMSLTSPYGTKAGRGITVNI